MDNVNTLYVFVQVAETRSFVAAGRLLGVSASAVGKNVGRLEERLGVRLFHRSTRSITLTAEGLMLLERSRRILAEIAAAEAELRQTALLPQGRLRVSLPLVGSPFLAVLAQFKQRYPEVDLDLDFSDRRVELIEEGFDAVIRSGEVLDSRLTARHIGAFRMLLVGAPAYFQRYGTPRHPVELMDHACIQFRFPNTGMLQAWPLQDERTGARLQLPQSMVCNNLDARICFALHGLGIAYLPDFAIADSLASGGLVTVLDQVHGDNAFHIMWPSGKHPAPKLRVFIDFLKANLFASGSDANMAIFDDCLT